MTAGPKNVDTKAAATQAAEMSVLKKNMNELTTKLNNVESSIASLGKDSSKVASSANNAQVLYEVKNFKNEINTVNKKISEMESKLASAKTESSVSSAPSQEEINGLKKSLVQMQQSYVTLGKRLDTLKKDQSSYASLVKDSSDGSASLSSSQMKLINAKISSIREEVDNIKVGSSSAETSNKNTADIKRIEKRLSNLENSDRSSSSGSSDSDSGSGKGGTIAKVSLGLSLVAALFIAR